MATSTRRDILRAFLGAPALAASVGCAADHSDVAIPDGTLLDPGMQLGHRLRELHRAGRLAAPPPSADAPILDVAVVGGGVAGLAAVRRLAAEGVTAVEVFEIADVVGGTARSGRSDVTAFPWGAHYVTAPLADDTLTIGILDELGALEGRDHLGHPIVDERWGCREPEERLFSDGRFFEGLSPEALLDGRDHEELRRFEALLDDYAAMVDGAGRPAFALPRARSSTDTDLLALDRLTMREFLWQHGFSSPHLHWLCDYAVRDDDGVSIDEASAWAGLFYFCARRRPGVAERGVITRPEGNGVFVAHLAKTLRVPPHTDCAVVDVRPLSSGAVDGVTLTLLDAAGALRTVRARHAVVATPRFIAGHIVEPLRRAKPPWLSSVSTSAWVVCNVHLRERPRDRGVSLAWDTVAVDSASLGYVNATHQRGVDRGPTVWTWYLPLVDRAPEAARRELLEVDRAGWADVCLSDLERMHPGVRAMVTRVDVARFGHAMVRPVPGTFSSGVLEAAAAPVGPIHFAHTDLSGMALFEEALFHGTRAAEAILLARGHCAPSWLP